MLPGYNHNLQHLGRLFHIQTEDSGTANPHVSTHLFYGGVILHSLRTSYAELVGADDLAQTVTKLMQDQHKAMMRGLIRGEFDAQIQADQSSFAPPVAALEAQSVVESSDAPPPAAPPPVEVRSSAPPPAAPPVVEVSSAPPPARESTLAETDLLPLRSDPDRLTAPSDAPYIDAFVGVDLVGDGDVAESSSPTATFRSPSPSTLTTPSTPTSTIQYRPKPAATRGPPPPAPRSPVDVSVGPPPPAVKAGAETSAGPPPPAAPLSPNSVRSAASSARGAASIPSAGVTSWTPVPLTRASESAASLPQGEKSLDEIILAYLEDEGQE